MKKDNYEEHLNEIMKGAKVLDHTKDVCADNFIPDTQVIKLLLTMNLNYYMQCDVMWLSLCGMKECQINKVLIF